MYVDDHNVLADQFKQLSLLFFPNNPVIILDILFVQANLTQLRIWNSMTVLVNISKQIKSLILNRQINFLTFMNYDYAK